MFNLVIKNHVLLFSLVSLRREDKIAVVFSTSFFFFLIESNLDRIAARVLQ